jgi:hypothetical protein
MIDDPLPGSPCPGDGAEAGRFELQPPRLTGLGLDCGLTRPPPPARPDTHRVVRRLGLVQFARADGWRRWRSSLRALRGPRAASSVRPSKSIARGDSSMKAGAGNGKMNGASGTRAGKPARAADTSTVRRSPSGTIQPSVGPEPGRDRILRRDSTCLSVSPLRRAEGPARIPSDGDSAGRWA